MVYLIWTLEPDDQGLLKGLFKNKNLVIYKRRFIKC